MSGLTGTGLTLDDNVGDSVSIPADGSFVFASDYASGQQYQVTVTGQPASELCAVTAAGSGTIGSANVGDIDVECRAAPTFAIKEYAVPGLIAGLANVSDGSLWALSSLQSSESGAVTWTNTLEQITTGGTVSAVPVLGTLAATTAPLGPPVAGPNEPDVWVASVASNKSGPSTTFASFYAAPVSSGSSSSSTAGGTQTASQPVPGGATASLGVFDGCGNLWYASPYPWTTGADTTIGTIPLTGLPASGNGNCPAGATTATSVTLKGADVAAMTLGPDGRIWFTSQAANAIGVITPVWMYQQESGQPPPQTTLTTWTLPAHPDDVSPAGALTGSEPNGIALGSDGNMWFVEQAQPTMRIGCFRPGLFDPNAPSATSPSIVEFTVTDSGGYQLGPSIASGPDGSLWFSVWTEQVGNIAPVCDSTQSPKIALSTLPSADAWPSALTAGPDGRMWFTEPADVALSGGRVGAACVTAPATAAACPPVPAPANDSFANATVLPNTTNAGVASTNDYQATSEPGEPSIISGTIPMSTLWWRWTAPASGTLVVNTFGSSYETVIGIFAFENGSSLTSFSGLAACASGGAQPCPLAYGRLPGPGLSNVAVPVTAGTTYAIDVDGNNGATGVLLLDWQFTAS